MWNVLRHPLNGVKYATRHGITELLLTNEKGENAEQACLVPGIF